MAQLLSNPQTLNQSMNQAKAAPTTQPTNQIPYWGYFGGMEGGGAYMDYDPTNTDMGKQFLDAVHKYDPNAAFVSQGALGGEGGSGQQTWIFQGDRSKIPFYQHDHLMDMNEGDFNPMYYGNPAANPGYSPSEMAQYAQQHPHSFDRSQLYNPNAIGNDPILGQVTDRRNLRPQGRTLLDILGPLAVGGFGSLLGGGGMLASLLQKAPQTIGSFANGNFNPWSVAGMALPFIPGIGKIPFMSTLGRAGLNYVGSQRRGG